MNSQALKREKSGQPWSVDDHAKLIRLFKEGVKPRKIAKKLQRSTGAILNRLLNIDLLDIKRNEYVVDKTGKVYHKFY